MKDLSLVQRNNAIISKMTTEKSYWREIFGYADKVYLYGKDAYISFAGGGT